ncbi:Flp family type IVb pilin [Actinocorallia populi]|uniref:Flp family type IVb pilin n=1 Tax=Actinocorallia populi TaxID=2079200 RepID=UPI000D086A34|nr:Flp family type IVb pilin [Actinocorallia populi]
MINQAVILLQTGCRTLLERCDAASRDRGATAVEYALIVSLIAVAIVAIVATLGETIVGIFTDANTQINDPQPIEGEGAG